MTATGIIVCIIVAIAFCALGIYVATNKMRQTLTKNATKVLKEAEEKAEMMKKEKLLQAKEQFLQMSLPYLRLAGGSAAKACRGIIRRHEAAHRYRYLHH